MADTVGSLMVEAGMNLAGFEESVKQIPAITSKHMERMSAEMKRTTREGAESLRLIDEALGIHISRPLSRIIAEIPGVGSALQGLLGGAAFGAFAVAGVEFYDKLVKGIEHAQKVQEEFKQSTQKLNDTYEEVMASYEKAEKLQSLTGLKKKLFEIDSSSIELAQKRVVELSAAAEKNAKDAAEAAKWWIIAGAAVGDFFHVMVNADSSLSVERMNKGYAELTENLHKLSVIDALQGSHAGLEFAEEALARLQNQMTALKAHADDMDRTSAKAGMIGYADESPKIDALKRQLDFTQQIVDAMRAAAKLQTNSEGDAKKADALEREKKALQDLQQQLTPLNDEANKYWQWWQKTNDEIDKAIEKLGASDFSSIGKRFEAQRGQLLPWIQEQPTLAPGAAASHAAEAGSAVGQLTSFGNDGDAQAQLIRKAFADAIGPAGQLALRTDELKISFSQLPPALKNSVEGMAAFNSALKMLKDAETEAETKTAHLEQAMLKLEKQSDSAGAGVMAALVKIEMNNTFGKFGADLTTTGISGFEDNTIKMLEGTKVHWDEYFKSIETTALKFAMNKSIIGGLNAITPKNADGTADTTTTLGKLLGPLLGKGKDGALDGNTAALVHLTAVLSSGQLSSSANSADAAGDSGTGNFASLLSGLSLTPHAAGGDVSPGQGYLVGENGPEPFFPGISGTIAPNSSLGKGDTHIHNNYDFSDFKGDASLMNAVTAMVEKRGQQAEQRAVVQNNERSLRTTSGH
jgi:hypothetical protein